MPLNEEYRSGFVTIIGKPNVGKSTLLNRLIGEKLSIVTPKPQTTRHYLKGIFTDKRRQIVFIDTPGFLKPRYELQHKMLMRIEEGISDSDLVIFMTDHHFATDYDKELCEILQQKKNINKIAVVNKTDLISEEVRDDITGRLHELGFHSVSCISALNDENLDYLLDNISNYLPVSPPLYPPGDLSDLPVRFFVQEIIREQIFLNFKEEVPYSSTVTVEQFNEMDNKIEILANVWLERKTQKIIFIGKKGKMIKHITELSERELYKFLGKRVKLELWVKVKQNWRKKKNAIKELGY